MVKRLFHELTGRLSRITDDPRFEAEVIFQTVFGRDWRLKELSGRLAEPSASELEALGKLEKRRLSGEPLQYIVGEWEFYGLTLKVAEGALIPRQDTERLVDVSLGLIEEIPRPRILDLCSGTGCIALAIKSRRPDAEITALELYPAAYEILRENCRRYGGVEPLRADALKPQTAEGFSGLDLITANPPYLTAGDMNELQRELEFEPKTALFGGADGLDFYRAISKVWHRSLREGGYIALEIGAAQKEAVSAILKSSGWREIRVENDLAGKPRVAIGRK